MASIVSNLIDRLKGKVVQEGHDEGSPAFQKRLLQVRVEKCQELHGVMLCTQCPYSDNCELSKEFLRSQLPEPVKKASGQDVVAVQKEKEGPGNDKP